MKTEQSLKNKRVIHFNKTMLHLPATHVIHNQGSRESMQEEGLVFTLYPFTRAVFSNNPQTEIYEEELLPFLFAPSV